MVFKARVTPAIDQKIGFWITFPMYDQVLVNLCVSMQSNGKMGDVEAFCDSKCYVAFDDISGRISFPRILWLNVEFGDVSRMFGERTLES